MATTILVVLAGASSLLLAPRSARADSDPSEPDPSDVGPPPAVYPNTQEPHQGGQRYFGFGPHIGLFWGFGANVRAGHPRVGVEVFGGWQPIVIVLQEGTNVDVKGFHSGQVGGHVYVTFNPKSKFVAGLTAGYRYNSLLGHGVGGGFQGLVDISKKLMFSLALGPVVFPDGENAIRATGEFPEGTSFNFPGPSVQLGLGLGLMIFP